MAAGASDNIAARWSDRLHFNEDFERGRSVTTYSYDVIVVGGGPAGLCAGLYAGRAMLNAVILERGLPGGELLNTEVVEDYIGFEHILGRDLADKFAAHARKFGVELKEFVHVESVVKRTDGLFEVKAEGGDVYEA